MAYQPGIPTGSVPLNQDYLNIQGNFTSLNTQFNEDHVPLTSTSGNPPNGYHTTIHLVPPSTTATNPPNNFPPTLPAATVGFGQLNCPQTNDGVGVDTQLYFQSGGGFLTQMTRNIQPLNASQGYTFLPGGFIMQWNTVTFTGSLAVVYQVTLSAAAYSIQLTQFNNGSSNIREFGQVFATSATGFTIRAIQDGGGVSSSPTTFYWCSIGY